MVEIYTILRTTLYIFTPKFQHINIYLIPILGGCHGFQRHFFTWTFPQERTWTDTCALGSAPQATTWQLAASCRWNPSLTPWFFCEVEKRSPWVQWAQHLFFFAFVGDGTSYRHTFSRRWYELHDIYIYMSNKLSVGQKTHYIFPFISSPMVPMRELNIVLMGTASQLLGSMLADRFEESLTLQDLP